MQRIQTRIAIIGGGPAGLATANTLQSAGHATIVFDKGSIANHVSQYPTHMNFFSTPDLLELGGLPLIVTREKPTLGEYLNYLRRFVKETRLDVRTGHEITGMTGEIGDFELQGVDRTGEAFEVRAERVVLATGGYATPRMLDVPGEDLPKVSHYFSEVHPYFGSKVLIVGGKNSAIETALELWRAGVDVAMCHRGSEFKGHVKYWLLPDIENRIKNGEIPIYRPARVVEIRPKSVVLEKEGEAPIEIENDFVLALTGYIPDPDFLVRFGVRCDPKTCVPAFDSETLQTERPGVFMVGVMLAGNASGAIFIENSRTHGEQILKHLEKRSGLRAAG